VKNHIRLVRWPDSDRAQWQDWLLAAQVAVGPRTEAPVLTAVPDQPAEPVPVDGAAELPTPPEQPSYVERAAALYEQRRLRQRLFGHPDGLFQEPAWDMLLHLFIQQERGDRVPISNLSSASCVPQTTALRWIKVLEREGLARCWQSKSDARVRYVELTPHAQDVMLHYLDQI